ncbi:MAG TPA: cytochrome b/b6 domain-containing protein [Alphaproteobacteria bacterium]|nr:cytochrome b/b6 domain-containing protein [Alphaproteobacteria bacterium]
MRHSLVTKALHALLACAILFQLLVSLVMEEPHPPRRPIETPFLLHEWVGMASLAIVILFWLWTLVRRSEAGVGAFFPWFSAARRSAIFADLRAYGEALRRLEMPDATVHTAFANAVHGLGLLLATYLAVTGSVVFWQMDATGKMTGLGHSFAELHGALANVMWAYLIGHAGMALLHQLLGEGILRKMWTIKG